MIRGILHFILAFFVTAPIWYYLLYQILVRVNATELMFFLFWIYVPVGFISHILSAMKAVETAKKGT